MGGWAILWVVLVFLAGIGVGASAVAVMNKKTRTMLKATRRELGEAARE